MPVERRKVVVWKRGKERGGSIVVLCTDHWFEGKEQNDLGCLEGFREEGDRGEVLEERIEFEWEVREKTFRIEASYRPYNI